MKIKQKQKILVTGSSGTIGTRLCEKLLSSGFDVIGLDIKKNKWSDKVNAITSIVDLRVKKQVFRKIPKNIDIIIHLAANARVFNLVLEPKLAMDNVDMTFNMLEFARLNKINKFVFSSSREVYGNGKIFKKREKDFDLSKCESSYSASKISCEAFIQGYSLSYKIDHLIFRFSNVYGMYDESDRVIPLFIDLISKGKDIHVYGKDKLLDFTYIDDVVDTLINSIKKFDSIKNDTFNIAYGEGTSILYVAEKIKGKFKTNSKIILDKNRTGEVVKYIADINKAKKKLFYNPKISIDLGIKKTIDWYIKNK